MRYAVVIPAAGSGSRMGAAVPKVLLPWSDDQNTTAESILKRTVRTFAADDACERIVVCVPAEWRSRFEVELVEFPRIVVVVGGDTRQRSVYNGVQALAEVYSSASDDVVVLVHDAARCCLTKAVVSRVIKGVIQYGAVTAAVPIVDSVCRQEGGAIQHYVDRRDLWTIQTPQGFRLRDLIEAHQRARESGLEALDDAALVAQLRPVHLVEGDRVNIKVTQPGDLQIARSVLINQEI